MLNRQDGISLVQIIVAIIIIIIIASFAVWYAERTSREAKLTRIYAEISAVKEAYNNAKVLNEVGEDSYVFSETEKTLAELQSIYEDEGDLAFDGVFDEDILYLITPENAKQFELQKIEFSYVIDANTDKIYLIGGFSRNNTDVVYEYNEIVRLYNSTFK